VKNCAALHKEQAFQASSPKTLQAVLRGGFFLPFGFLAAGTLAVASMSARPDFHGRIM